ncbi:Stp1/IreP family PP2C-type Ser/Thr phosphatase [Curtobacterium sp. MCJR17_043]|uniref:Stp1/IreP family PP2C-type Ser/Thr phosphatase n=1 Tax=Curtobacterium sp. MCJR17_043 TaxID=2175660 RepID=UPI0032E85365
MGRIRANNQDSGYAGQHLFAVADGMGGHAGGDVASAIAIRRIREVDREFTSAHDAEFALQSALIAANQLITETVFEHQELTGMGTTVSAMIRVGDQLAIAHIGDSRIYRWRDGELQQITSDHTFVQRLVDSGRITPEEAAVHPRRSVLMRVLGDVDAAPEVDTAVMDIRPGDRWLLCSDGLSSYLAEERIRHALASSMDANQVTQRLVKETLDHGAPDNVTVVVLDVTDSEPGEDDDAATTVGSAAAPLTFEAPTGRKPIRLPHDPAAPAQGLHRPGGLALRARVGPVLRRAHRRGPSSPHPPSHLVVGRARRGGPGPRRSGVHRLPHRAGPLLRGHRRRLGRDLQGRPADHRAGVPVRGLRGHRHRDRRTPRLHA